MASTYKCRADCIFSRRGPIKLLSPDRRLKLDETATSDRQARSARKLTVAVTIVAALSSSLLLQAPASAAETPILGAPQATSGQAQAWARRNNASQLFVDLAPVYWRVAPSRGGVRPEVAYAQHALETGWMRFAGGAVAASYHNPCGMKKPAGGADSDTSAYQRYSTWEEGITACIDHLALYAAAPGYPKPPGETPDGKQCRCLLGVATTVEQLGGKWAPSKSYGTHIVEGLLNPMLGTARPPADPVEAPAPPPESQPPAAEVITGLPEEPEVVSAIRVSGLKLAGLGMATATEAA